MPDARAAKGGDIFVNGRFMGQRVTGVQRYGWETLRSLDTLLAERPDTATRWTVLIPPGVESPELAHIAVRTVGHLNGHLWEQLELPWYARSGFLIGFGFTGPLVKRNQIITIHDAAVIRMPEAYGWKFRAWYRIVVKTIAAKAPWICVVSQFSAREATACFGIPASRLRVMVEGWQHIERVTSDDWLIEREDLKKTPFVLVVSSPTPNKNFAVVGDALRQMGREAPLCVAVGALDTHVFRSDQGDSSIRYVGYVTDGELKALYEHATCFVFPSFYEGFGIPALEAMALGCPVVVSTAPALLEVGGDAVCRFAPNDAFGLANQIKQLFGDPALRQAMRERGLLRSTLFDWKDNARLLLTMVHQHILQPDAAPVHQEPPNVAATSKTTGSIHS